MFFHNINYWTVIIAAIATMALGSVWYSPLMFLKRFIKEMGVTAEQVAEHKKNDSGAKMAKRMAPVFVLALLSAFITAALLGSLVVTSISGLLLLAVCIWAGFSLPVAVNNTIFGDDSVMLSVINSSFQLVNLIIITLIIGIWG